MLGQYHAARRVALSGLEVQRVASRQDGPVVAAMALRWADVADAAVAVLDVVPMHELSGPGAVRIQPPGIDMTANGTPRP
jgi:hypothetical protein